MQDNRLLGRVAIVTGAGQGLGANFAVALASAGADVVVGDLIPTEATCARVEATGRKALGMRVDVTDAKSIQAMVDAVRERFGRVDVLLNNAAISGELRLTPMLELTSAAWDRVMAVNARGPFEMIKAFAPLMIENGGGSVINISSGTALKGSPGLLHYVASKGAVISLTRASARELGDKGIRVNCIAPGLTMSESIQSNESWTDEARAANIASRAIKRIADPDDLIGTLLFLASSDSAFITGQTIVVDGGSAMV